MLRFWLFVKTYRLTSDATLDGFASGAATADEFMNGQIMVIDGGATIVEALFRTRLVGAWAHASAARNYALSGAVIAVVATID